MSNGEWFEGGRPKSDSAKLMSVGAAVERVLPTTLTPSTPRPSFSFIIPPPSSP